MAFTYAPAANILRWPDDLRPNQMTVHLQSHTSRFEAPFTRSTQTQELPGGRFTVSASFPPLIEAKTRKMRAFAAKLRGSAGRFYWGAEAKGGIIPAFGESEAGPLLGLRADSTNLRADSTTVTADATQYTPDAGLTVITGGDSVTIYAASVLTVGAIAIEAGRHISFDTADGWRHLCIVTDDAIVQADQKVHISVEPPMRVRPAEGASLHVKAPSGVFMLTDDDQLQISQTPGVFGQVTIEAVQAYPMRISV